MKSVIDFFKNYLAFAIALSVAYWVLTLLDKGLGYHLGGALDTFAASAIAWWYWQWSSWQIEWIKLKGTVKLLLIYYAAYSFVFFIGSLVMRSIIFDDPQRILFFYHFPLLVLYMLTLCSSFAVFLGLHCLSSEGQRRIGLIRQRDLCPAAAAKAGDAT